jgi:hypothetical protein
VTVVVVLLWVQAIAELILGLTLVVEHGTRSFRNQLNWSSSTITTYGILLIVLGAITAYFAYSLGHGSNAARVVVSVLLGLAAIAGLVGFFEWDNSAKGNSLLQFVLSVVALFFLWHKESTEYFMPETVPLSRRQ